MIPLLAPALDGNEKKYAVECITTGEIFPAGPFVEQLEKKTAEFTVRRFGIAFNDFTAAFEAALFALEIRAGQRVIMSSFAPLAAAIATVRAGAIPYIIDIAPTTQQLDLAVATKLLAKADPLNAAIFPASFCGKIVNPDSLLPVCEKYQTALIEEVSPSAEYQAHYFAERSDNHWKKSGTAGKVALWSFNIDQNITTGGGGVLLANSETIAERACKYRGHHHDNLFTSDCALGNLAAAVGVAQLERLPEIIAQKQKVIEWYAEGLCDIPAVRLLAENSADTLSTLTMIPLELQPDSPQPLAAVIENLRAQRIAIMPFTFGLHAHPALRYLVEIGDGGCPYAEQLAERGFYLPAGSNLSRQQIATVCEILRNFLRR